MTVENKWCMTIYGHDWTASVSSQIECQSVCLASPLCVGISYSYRAGMANSCFLCKDLPPSLESNSYEFSFYRKPGKILLFISCIHALYLYHVNYITAIFHHQHVLILDCNSDNDCTGNSDTCVSNFCRCGSSARCSAVEGSSSGKTDTCIDGLCVKCGNNDECSEYDICILGECKGMFIFIIKSFEVTV